MKREIPYVHLIWFYRIEMKYGFFKFVKNGKFFHSSTLSDLLFKNKHGTELAKSRTSWVMIINTKQNYLDLLKPRMMSFIIGAFEWICNSD